MADWNGEGETVGGIVVVRYGADTYKVINAVKAKLAELKSGLPEGVEVQVAYDRTSLIDRAIETLKASCSTKQFLIVALVCMIFLLHVRSALVAILSLPIGVLLAFVVMHLQGINANIMSLGGIAIAIGAMVDAAHHHDRKRAQASRARPRQEAALADHHRGLDGSRARRCFSRCW